MILYVVLYFMKWGAYVLNFLPFVGGGGDLGFILFCFAMFSSSTIFGQSPSFLETLSAAYKSLYKFVSFCDCLSPFLTSSFSLGEQAPM